MSRMRDSARPEQSGEGSPTVEADPERLEELPVEPSSDSINPDAVLAGCPRTTWRPDPEVMISFAGSGPARGAEEFRLLRSRLYQLQGKHTLKSILIASALPGEGKSFVAANLARVLALQPNCRVLLIDANLRSPRQHSVFGTSARPGFSEYLLQEVDEFGVMQKGGNEHLFLIPAGRDVAGPTELVANGRLKSLTDRLGPLFDWIIVDSPAALPVSDAGLLANHCDGVLMVVRSLSSPYDEVRKARGRFREESLVGVVLNEIPARPPRSETK